MSKAGYIKIIPIAAMVILMLYGESVAAPTGLYVEGCDTTNTFRFRDTFDDGDVAGWTLTKLSGADWSTNSSVFRSASYSARSGVIGDSSWCAIEKTIVIPTGGATVSFWWKVSCEYHVTNLYDRLEFYIDGVPLSEMFA